ncbi:MAG TPA: phenylalanine--tRNA ligase subunit beta, partial [Mangrovimonas sp.]|nr:phenylalanine--tRNA ligase subunit beta [Mangrovimonas sp.]
IKLSKDLKDEFNVTILNPLSNDLSVLRQSMLFSGLESIAFNLNRKQGDLKLFEFGKTYHNYSNREEIKHLTLFATGNKTTENWKVPTEKINFFYFKGLVAMVLERLGLTNYQTEPVTTDTFAEGLKLGLGKMTLVEFGLVKKPLLKHFDIDKEVFFADFNWDTILKVTSGKAVKVSPIAKYPEVRRDFALLLDQNVSFDAVYKLAKQTEKQLLKSVNLFDVYEGKNLPQGKKSYAVSFTLQDENKTLTDKQIDKVMKGLQSAFETQLGAELR